MRKSSFYDFVIQSPRETDDIPPLFKVKTASGGASTASSQLRLFQWSNGSDIIFNVRQKTDPLGYV